jgi:large subunit ribosomal protein L18
MALSKTDRRERLRFRIRKTVSGTTQRPRFQK